MDKKIFAVVSLLIFSFVFLPAVSSAACRLVGGKTYYTDGVSFFSDSACRREMTAAELSAPTAAAPTAAGYIGSGNSNCRYSLAKRQYTDSISFFTDNKCNKEALNDEAVPAPVVSAAAAPAQTAALTQSATPVAAVSGISAQAIQRIAALEKRVDILTSLVSRILALLAKK